MEAHGLTLWSLEDARRIHHHILHMFRQASRERNPEKRQAYLSFVIGRGGFTGIEKVGELIQWVDVFCKEYEMDRKEDHFLKDHLVPRSYTAFLVIMRLYLGYMWLMQGIKKYQEGWLTQTIIYAQRIGPALPDAIANPRSAADTSAEAVQKGLNLVGQHTPYWYAWILENIIVPNALLFQNMIVLTEIALGLAFLTGTFTFIAALISIGMNINFLFSTGLYDYWYIVTSIACIAGGKQDRSDQEPVVAEAFMV